MRLTAFQPASFPAEASLSPNLLTRAQSGAAEHAKLAAQNAESYDVAVAKKIGELGPVTTALKDWQDAQHVRGQTLYFITVRARKSPSGS